MENCGPRRPRRALAPVCLTFRPVLAARLPVTFPNRSAWLSLIDRLATLSDGSHALQDLRAACELRPGESTGAAEARFRAAVTRAVERARRTA